MVVRVSKLLISLCLTGCATSGIPEHQSHSFVYGCLHGLLYEQSRTFEMTQRMPSTVYNLAICKRLEEHYIRGFEEKGDGTQ